MRIHRLKLWVGQHLEEPVRDCLTELGERRGIDWLIYNPLRMRVFHRYAVRDANAVIGALDDVLPGRLRWADVGAGSGAFAAEAQRRHHQVTAYERSRVGRWLAARQGVECLPFDLRQASPAPGRQRTYDLAYCFEVAEHLPPTLGDQLVSFLASLAPTIVFTAAHPGQGGAGHVNEQLPEYWERRFASHGFASHVESSRELSDRFVEHGVIGAWFAENVRIFQRTSQPVDPEAGANPQTSRSG